MVRVPCFLLFLILAISTFAGCGPKETDVPPNKTDSEEADAIDVGENEPAPLPAGVLSSELVEAGWLSLFDGETLFGWEKTGDANFRIEDKTIVVDDGEKCLLLTTTAFADYELHVEFLAAEGANSGVFLHMPGPKADPKTECYELNIAPPTNGFPTGSFVFREKVEGVPESNEWRAFDITVNGDEVKVKLDGEEILVFTDPEPLKRGKIGLQHNEGRTAFRNIRLRPLNLEPLFNGKDLAGWNEYPDMDSTFTATEAGELHVLNGRGQLETKAEFGDFVMQLECKTNAPRLNSGIFFRCIPGEQMNGYESQIHNGYEGVDRTKPIDTGTGGIFRRQAARVVAADDLQWFGQTIIANGDHFSAWVNGLQVADWTDDRPADANPRKGLRTEAGTIMIQGHDPTTDILFRNLQAAETPGR